MNELKDEELLERFKTGDIDSFEVIFNRHSAYIKNYINSSIHNSDVADEIMQEVFVVLYKSPEKYNGESSVLNFLLAIAKFKVYEHFRKKKNRKDIFDKNAPDLFDGDRVEDSALDILERNEDISQVNEILNSLNPTYRRVIKLIDFEEMSYEEAARRMNKSTNQIKITIHRARKALEKEMRRRYPDTVEKYSKRRDIISIILVSILGVTLLTGLVYAAIKFYQNHVNNKESFKLSEIEAVPEEDSVNITRDHAKEIIGLYLDALGISEYDLEKVELSNELIIENKVVWCLKDEKYVIWIDACDGSLVRFDDYNDFDSLEKENKDEEYYINKTNDLYNVLKFNKEYEICDKNYSDIGESYTLLTIVYADTNAEIINNYQSVVFEYICEIDLLRAIRTYNYELNDKDILISEDEAINIVKEKYGDVEILDVKEYYELKFNSNLDNNVDGDADVAYEINYNSKIELIRVWRIEISINGFKEIISINGVDGNEINHDKYAEQEKKKNS